MIMRLVWVVIPLVLFGIVGVQESFAEEKTWYLGEGIDEGDFFSYSVCHLDYKDCLPFEIHLLVIEKHDSFLEVNFTIIENGVSYDETISIDTETWKFAQYSETIKLYVEIFEEGITSWSNIANHENPKTFDEVWFKTSNIGGKDVRPNSLDSMEIDGIVFDTANLRWSGSTDGNLLIADEFPFPINSELSVSVNVGNKPKIYSFNLLTTVPTKTQVNVNTNTDESSLPDITKCYPNVKSKNDSTITTDKEHYNFDETITITYTGNVVQILNPENDLILINQAYGSSTFHITESFWKLEGVYTIVVSNGNVSYEKTFLVTKSGNEYNSISLQLDKTTYTQGERIVVTGKLCNVISAEYVILQILDPHTTPINLDQFLSDDNVFHKEYITEGSLWKSEGEYTVKGTYLQDHFEIKFTFITDSKETETAKPTLDFVDTKKDPQYYIDRYNKEPSYKKWFDKNYPDYTIEEAVGYELVREKVPLWIKDNAKLWADSQIDDNSFKEGIQHMIKEDIITIDNLPETSSVSESKIPDWIKQNAKWWADGSLSEEDFLNGIEYLVGKRIIQVS